MSVRHSFTILLGALFLTGCSTSSGTRTGTSPDAAASMESVQQFLITTAASDFHEHGPSHVMRFRDVHLRYLVTSTGERTYILCGQFLADNQEPSAGPTPFVTIKTDPYEQWIGGNATSYCADSMPVTDGADELSSSLQQAFDALR
jgi:hypothetical protein